LSARSKAINSLRSETGTSVDASSGSGALATSVTAAQLAPSERAAPCYLDRFSARKTACLIPTVS
jgi:hypothetical protein